MSGILPSHSALVSQLRSILGKHQIRWLIHEIRFLKEPGRLTTITNELKALGRGPVDSSKMSTQRMTVWLTNVDYVVFASFTLSKECDRPGNTIKKYEEMMDRRLELGQSHSQPYFGMSECHANFEPADPETLAATPAVVNEDLGLAYYDTDWDNEGQREYYAPLRVVNGVAIYPTWDEVRKLGISRKRVSA